MIIIDIPLPCYLCVTLLFPLAFNSYINFVCESVYPRPLKVHVDAAYGGAYCVCDEYRYMLDGIEDADSIAINAHKQVIIYMICDCIPLYHWMTILRKERAVIQTLIHFIFM